MPAADWDNGLILHSTYPGKGHPTNPLTVTVSNIGTRESFTAPAKTITVTDPPVASTFDTSDGNPFEISGPATLGDLRSNSATFMASDPIRALLGQYIGNQFESSGPTLADLHSNDTIATLLATEPSFALLGQYMASQFTSANAGPGGTVISAPSAGVANDSATLVAPHHA